MVHRIGRWRSKLVAKNRNEGKRFICLCQCCNINKLGSFPGGILGVYLGLRSWVKLQIFQCCWTQNKASHSDSQASVSRHFFSTDDGLSSQLDLKLDPDFQNSRVVNLKITYGMLLKEFSWWADAPDVSETGSILSFVQRQRITGGIEDMELWQWFHQYQGGARSSLIKK